MGGGRGAMLRQGQLGMPLPLPPLLLQLPPLLLPLMLAMGGGAGVRARSSLGAGSLGSKSKLESTCCYLPTPPHPHGGGLLKLPPLLPPLSLLP